MNPQAASAEKRDRTGARWMPAMAKMSEMERYLDQNPDLDDPRYQAMQKRGKSQWGRRLRMKWPEEFKRRFLRWWQKSPELWELA